MKTKRFFRILMTLVLTIAMVTGSVTTFAAENVTNETTNKQYVRDNEVIPMSQGSFPDYDNYWYNGSNSKTGNLYVLGNPNGSKTGLTVKIENFDSSTGVAFDVYNADTGSLIGSGNITHSYRGDYLWTNKTYQDIMTATTVHKYRIHFSIVGFPNASSGRVMVWSYAK